MSVRMGSLEGTSRAAESYDVFINHRGPDAKNGFVSHLVAALRRVGLRPFLDEKDIEPGGHVSKSIDEALQGSCVHLAIFSKRYAQSRYCLNELCDMLKSGKNILPVFYHVQPKDLRMIEDSPFKDGFRKHIDKETEEQILKWKEALCKITDIRGLRLDEVNGNEEELVRRILAEVRKLMPIVLPEAAQDPKPPEELIVTFNQGDRRLNVLVLGDLESVEAVISRICDAGRHASDHVNFRESRNSSPPMCLYSQTKGFNINDFTNIRTFVKDTNGKFHPTRVQALWVKEIHHSGSRNRPAVFPDSTLRLHMVWFVCRNLSDLPDRLHWPKITKELCDLPVQILVIEKQRTQDLDLNVEEDLKKIRDRGSHFFPKSGESMDDLIVKVTLGDDDLKEKLWRKCWAVKTRVEIGNAAKIIRNIRKELGPAGKSFQTGVGGGTISEEESLSRSGEFVLHFLCSYWDIPQDSLRRVLQTTTTGFILQENPSKISIEPRKFVEFGLKVAAIILYNARDNDGNPKYVCSWDVSSESSLDHLQTEARECFSSYFPSSGPLDYDKMKFEDIRLFLERIFERVDPREAVVSVDRNSLTKRIKSKILPK